MKNHMTLCLLCSVPAYLNYSCENTAVEPSGEINYSSISPDGITGYDQAVDIRPTDPPPSPPLPTASSPPAGPVPVSDPTPVSPTPPETRPPMISGPREPVSENESASPPNQILGSFLRCFIEESNKAVKIEVGCRFHDANNERALVSELTKRAEYSLPRILPFGVSLAIEALDSNPQYDVLFHLSGKTFAELRSVAYGAAYSVKLFGLQNGIQEMTLVDETHSLLSFTPRPWWLRESASDGNQDGSCDLEETCRFESSALLWTRDNGQGYQKALAAALCASYDDGYSDWRLPTRDELQVAYAKQMSALKPAGLLNLRFADYWAETAGERERFSLVNVFTGEQRSAGAGDRAGVLCVRELLD